LAHVSMPGGVKYVGDRAFAWCESLGSIEIPLDVAHIGDEVFYGCSKDLLT